MATTVQGHAMAGNPQGGADEARRRNVRTALILLSVAAVFFAGIIAKFWLFGG